MDSEQRPQTLSSISEVSAHAVPQPRVTKEQQSEQLVDDDDDADGDGMHGRGGAKGAFSRGRHRISDLTFLKLSRHKLIHWL